MPETNTLLHTWDCPSHGRVLDGIGPGTHQHSGPRYCPFVNDDGSDCSLPITYGVTQRTQAVPDTPLGAS